MCSTLGSVITETQRSQSRPVDQKSPRDGNVEPGAFFFMSPSYVFLSKKALRADDHRRMSPIRRFQISAVMK